MSEETGADDEQAGTSPLRRTLDLCLFAPVGVAVTVVEDLPELIAKGRRRVELQLGNARVVGRFVVHKSQRQVSERLDDLLGNGATTAAPVPSEDADGGVAETSSGPADHLIRRPRPSSVVPWPTTTPSAPPRSSGGSRAWAPRSCAPSSATRHRTRNRRTILNRAGQLLDERPLGPPSD